MLGHVIPAQGTACQWLERFDDDGVDSIGKGRNRATALP